MNTVPGATSLGISLGTGNLYAVPGPEAVPVRHSAVLTIWPTAPDGGGSAPEGGTATENPRLRPGGLTITGFIDRLGDPVPITAPDGGAHAAESLTADAIRSIARAATGGFPTASTAVVAYPGWWPGDRVAALRDTLGEQVLLESDIRCALAELGQHPDFPAAGPVVLIDVGASGTTVALVQGDRILTVPVRVDKPSGNDIDLALLRTVLAEAVDDPAILAGNDPNMTAALSVLRARCTAAKEELSTATAVVVDVDLPGYRTDVRVTRGELDEIVGGQIDQVVQAIGEVTARAGGGPQGGPLSVTDLHALAAVGGGASIGALAQHLSGVFHLPVVIDRDPATTTARGAARIARPAGSPPRTVAPQMPSPQTQSPRVPSPRVPSPPMPSPRAAAPQMAAPEMSAPQTTAPIPVPGLYSPDGLHPPVPTEMAAVGGPGAGPRPMLTFAQPAKGPAADKRRRRWPVIVAAGAVVAVLGIAGTAAALHDNDASAPPDTRPSTSQSRSATKSSTSTTTRTVTPQQQEVVPETEQQTAPTAEVTQERRSVTDPPVVTTSKVPVSVVTPSIPVSSDTPPSGTPPPVISSDTPPVSSNPEPNPNPDPEPNPEPNPNPDPGTGTGTGTSDGTGTGTAKGPGTGTGADYSAVPVAQESGVQKPAASAAPDNQNNSNQKTQNGGGD